VIHTRPLPGKALYFPVKASFWISLSKINSETAFFRRSFSRSSSFNRFAWSSFRPPYSRRHL
jgi:hypothetical protein